MTPFTIMLVTMYVIVQLFVIAIIWACHVTDKMKLEQAQQVSRERFLIK